MKIRNGFVSNSSTSSFICDFCGDIAAGRDMCLDEADMQMCENGHTFCNDHIKEYFKQECIEGFKYAIKLINEKKFFLWFGDVTEDIRKQCKDELINILNKCIEDDICLFEKVDEFCDNSELEPLHNFDFGDSFNDTIRDYGIPSKYCPVCQRKRLMEKDSKYKEYLELYEHFNKVVPDGSCR